MYLQTSSGCILMVIIAICHYKVDITSQLM